jgi:ABC-2 type transport system permease protein
MYRWWRQYSAISRNAFVVCLSDPVYLIVLLTTLTAMAFFACIPSFTFGQEIRLLRDQSLALTFIGGCVLTGLGVVSVVVRDVRGGTLSIIMSRPLSPWSVMLGKWTGLAGALALYQLTVSLASLWMTRFTYLEYTAAQVLDTVTVVIYFASILLALAVMGLKHYFFGGWYAWQASLAVCVAFAIGFAISCGLGFNGIPQAYGALVDWPTAIGALLIFLAELIFLALILPLGVVCEPALLLSLAVLLFAVGIVADFALGRLLPAGFLLNIGHAIVPSWQAFWLSDFLAERKVGSSFGPAWHYLWQGLIHTVLYSTLGMLMASTLFARRELTGQEDL